MGSDHNLLLMKISMCSANVSNEHKLTATNIEKFNIESFQNQSTQQLYTTRLKEKISINSLTNETGVEEAWIKIHTNIIRAVEESIGKRTVKPNNKSRIYKPWFCQEVKDLSATKRAAYLKYKSHQISYDDYKVVRNNVNTAIDNIKKQNWESFSASMEHDLYGAQRKVWNMLRNLKKPVNECINFSSIPVKKWELYFLQLYENTASEDLEIGAINTPNLSGTTSPSFSITEEDVERSTVKLKTRKSPGPDHITNEMIKYGGGSLFTDLANFFNLILQNRTIPSAWKHSYTIPIFKKGDKKLLDNYRGITLLSSVLKLFTKILADHIAETGIAEEQQGFRRNRSTVDAIFILRQLVEKAIEYKKPAFLCFIDLTKAFDRVLLKDVIKILEKRNIDNNVLAVIRNLNTENTTSVKSNNEISNPIPVATGIRQGDSLSPILFNLIMDEIISAVKSTRARGYSLGNELKIMCYADDAVIVSDNEDDLQRMVYAFEKAASAFNMQISVAKTKSMTISKQPLRCKLAVYGKSIEQVMEFCYLGTIITSSKELTAEVNSHMNKAARISGCLRDVIWRNKHLSLKGKVRIYKTCVRPVLTYAVETRADTAATQQAMTKIEMTTLRSITGHTRRDLMRNDEIRGICDTQDVVRWSRRRRREWKNHVLRMSDNRLAKNVMTGKPKTTRPPGRPPKRWNECWTSNSTEN